MDDIQSAQMVIEPKVVPAPFMWSQPTAYELEPEYAGFWRRWLALLIDTIVLTIIVNVVRQIIERAVVDRIDDMNWYDPVFVAIWNVAYYTLIVVIYWLY